MSDIEKTLSNLTNTLREIFPDYYGFQIYSSVGMCHFYQLTVILMDGRILDGKQFTYDFENMLEDLKWQYRSVKEAKEIILVETNLPL